MLVQKESYCIVCVAVREITPSLMLVDYISIQTHIHTLVHSRTQLMSHDMSAYAQSDQSLCWSLEYSKSVKLLTEHHVEFVSLKGGCTGSSESTHVKMPHCWKSRVTARLILTIYYRWLFLNQSQRMSLLPY